MPGLQLQNVSKKYGEAQVIHDVSLTVEPGEFCVFVGPSGCGKSTLLRMIAGLEEITDGNLTIGGREMTDEDPARRGVAMVFQSYALYPHLSVAENMGFSMKIAGRPKAAISAAVTEAARILELSHLLDRKPKALSGGQRQRVAIGRAIVRKPDVFLFDEPLSNLDAELRVNMRVEIARLHRELGATMIYVTHDQVEAMTLADKIVVLRAGRIEQVGAPLTLYDDPDNVFIAGFIGSPRMNLLPGKVLAVAQGVAQVVFAGNEAVPLDVPLTGAPPAPGSSVTIGLRPDQFSAGAPTALPLMVEVVEHLGGESFIYGRDPRGERVVVKDAQARAICPGGRYDAAFDSRALLLFDEAGQRLR